MLYVTPGRGGLECGRSIVAIDDYSSWRQGSWKNIHSTADPGSGLARALEHAFFSINRFLNQGDT